MAYFFNSLNDKVKKASADLAPKAAQLQKQMNDKWAEVYGGADSMELYMEDENLAEAVKNMESVREAFRSLVAAVDAHYKALRKQSEAEKHVGEKLLQIAAFEKFYTPETIAVHVAVGKAEIAAASSMEKFASEMNAPLQRLNRSFEETYTKKVVPLMKRYKTQKSDYLKYKLQVEKEEDETKRSNQQALADATRPVWLDTSKQLNDESDGLASAMAKSLTEWTKSMVMNHRDSLASLNTSFKDAADKAVAGTKS